MKDVISEYESRSGTAKRKPRKTAGKTDTQLAIMLVTVSMAFLCLTSPPLITRMLLFSMEYRHDPRLFADMSLAIQLSTQMTVTRCCINVFLYLLTGSKFRRDLKALLCKTPARPSKLDFEVLQLKSLKWGIKCEEGKGDLTDAVKVMHWVLLE